MQTALQQKQAAYGESAASPAELKLVSTTMTEAAQRVKALEVRSCAPVYSSRAARAPRAPRPTTFASDCHD